MPERTPFDAWIAAKAGLVTLTREALRNYQMEKLRETVEWARAHNTLYARRLRQADCTRIESLPFMSADDLRESPGGFLCVSQSAVNRVVTLQTSGTSGEPKRIFFTADDQESTIDFFHHGILALAGPRDRVLVALPHAVPGSVGDLLAIGIERMGATVLRYGTVTAPEDLTAVMRREQVTCAVGPPVSLLAAARCVSGSRLTLRSVALCTDHVAGSVVRALREAWGCEVFEHYGATEMGLQGGVDCGAHAGYHLAEADLYFEIVDPVSGAPLPPGESGEVVFTTLTRRGMPLIRYRTGDVSRLLPGRCACGSVVQRLERVRERLNGAVALGTCGALTMPALDEALFAVAGVTGFTAAVEGEPPAALIVRVAAAGRSFSVVQCEVERALDGVPAIGEARRRCGLRVAVESGSTLENPGGGKRRIQRWAA